MQKRLALLLVLCLAIAIAIPALANPEDWGIVQADLTYLFSDATTESTMVAQYKRGDWMDVIGYVDGGEFYQVRTVDGKHGYVLSNDVYLTGAGQETGIVVNGGRFVNLREQPSTSSKVLAQMSDGSSLIILGTQGKWYEVNFNDQHGYVSSNLVKNSSTDGTTMYCVSSNFGSINMRAEPSADSDILTSVPYGAAIKVTLQGNGWYEISYNGYKGFMSSKYIQLNPPAPQPTVRPTARPNPTSAPAPVIGGWWPVSSYGYVNASSVNVRSGPGSDYNRIGTLYYGNDVYVTAQYANGWYLLSSPIDGYVSTNLITLGGQPVPVPTYVPAPTQAPIGNWWPVSVNGYATGNVNVRSGPGSSYSYIGSLSYGDSVYADAQYSNGWYHISYPFDGFVSSSYINEGDAPMPQGGYGPYLTTGITGPVL